jgi:hypothetical protein
MRLLTLLIVLFLLSCKKNAVPLHTPYLRHSQNMLKVKPVFQKKQQAINAECIAAVNQ